MKHPATEVIVLYPCFVVDVTPPIWLHGGCHSTLGFAPPAGFVIAVALLLGSTLDAAPSLSYAEEVTPPHCLVEDIASPASSAKGIAPYGPHQPKGSHQQEDILPDCPGPRHNYIELHLTEIRVLHLHPSPTTIPDAVTKKSIGLFQLYSVAIRQCTPKSTQNKKERKEHFEIVLFK